MKSFILVAALALAGAATLAAGPIVGQSVGNIASAAQFGPTSTGSSPIGQQGVRVTDAFGTVERKVGGDSSLSWKSVSVGDLLPAETLLRTGDNSAMLLELPRGHLLRISSQTTVLLRQIGQDNQYSFKVFGGQVWSLVRKANHPAKFEVETPSAVAGVTGTIFSVSADSQSGQTVVTTNEGSVVVLRNGQKAAVTQGNYVSIIPAPGDGGTPITVRAQSGEMRQMWLLLRAEGALVRHPTRSIGGGFGRARLERRIEPRLYQGYLNYGRGRFSPAPFVGTRNRLRGQSGPVPRRAPSISSGPIRRGDAAPVRVEHRAPAG